MAYRIAFAGDVETLDRLVNDAEKDGFRPTGGVTVVRMGDKVVQDKEGKEAVVPNDNR